MIQAQVADKKRGAKVSAPSSCLCVRN